MNGKLLLRKCKTRRRILSRVSRRLLAEKLEERALLAGDSCADVIGVSQLLEAEGEGPANPVVRYQVRVVPVGGALFMRDPVQTNVLIPTPDLTTVSVGESYDLAVTVAKVEPGPGVFSAYLDIGYDSSKTRVRVGEVQNLRISGLVGTGSSTSGTFSLTFDGETTGSIPFSSNRTALAASIQSALAGLTKIGQGHVRVRPVLSNSSQFSIQFIGKFQDLDAPNLTVAAQNLTGGNNPQVSLTYEGDLQGGVSALAFSEAFRSWGGATIVGVANGREYYPSDVAATNAANLIDNVGAFSNIFSSPFPGELTSVEAAAGFLAAPPREVVRATLVATAAGTITFSPDVVNVLRPTYNTLVHTDPGLDTWVRPEHIDTGAVKTLTVAPGAPIFAAADFATVVQGSEANAIQVLSNDTTNPVGQDKAVVAVTQPASGVVTFTAGGVVYTPPQNFVGQETFTYTARNVTAGAESATSTATVTVTVARPITAVPDTVSMIVHTFSTNIDVLANDPTTPGAGQTKSIVSVTQPGYGTVSIVENRVVYQPTPDYTGTDTFTYTARNTTAGATSPTSTATVSITINPAMSALMRYQVRLVPPNGALFMPDPQNPQVLVPTPDFSTLTVGDTYDMVVTVQASDPASLGVFAGYVDLGYDSSKTRVLAGEIQHVVISGNSPSSSVTGTFQLGFGGLTTDPITYSSNQVTLASRIEAALAALSSVGVGNVKVSVDVTSSFRFQVRFGGVLLGEDVPNMTVALQGLTGPNNPTVAVSYEGDLQGGNIPALAFTEAFRSRGVPSITTVATGFTPYNLDFSAGNLPNLIDDLGAFSSSFQPGNLTSAEIAAGIIQAPPRELVRARFRATAAGEFSFVPDLTNISRPQHDTLILGISGGISPAQIDLGTLKTLTIVPPYTAEPDTASIAEDSAGITIDVLANDGIFPAGATKVLIPTITIPEEGIHGTVSIEGSSIRYQPAANFVGTDTFIYTARSSLTDEGDVGEYSSATVTVTVTAVNDAPSFVKGPDQDVNDESGAVSVDGWATEIVAGPENEADQLLSFSVEVSDTSLFSVRPAINASGKLTYTPAMNVEGTAVVSVVLKDNGGTENDGSDTSETKSFEIRIIKLHQGHNAELPLDISGDKAIAANDALDAINFLNAFGSDQSLEDLGPGFGFLDVNADGYITAADPLDVINYLNAYGPSSPPPDYGEPDNGEGEGKGAETADDDSALISLLAFDAAESTTRRRQRN